jgi:nucleoside-diphosphate-sugar epimerase
MDDKMDRSGRSLIARAIADTVLVVGCLFIVMVGRLGYLSVFGSDATTSTGARDDFLATFVSGAVLVASITINTFYLTGIYRRTRHYQDRFKIAAIARSATVAQLVFAFVTFILWDFVEFPRSVLVPNWLLTTAALVTVRVYATRLTSVERLLGHIDVPGRQAPAETKRVLLVGGGGYIGSAVLRKLLDRGYRVRLLDLLLFGEEPIQDLVDHPNLELIRADFRQVHHAMRAVAGVDAVIHLGAIVGDPACALDEELTIKTNLMATRMLAEVAQCAGVDRFVFASTCSVYGAGDELLDESSTLNPLSLYAQSKIACEEVLEEMASDSFSPTILRFGTIYGLSGRTRFDLVVNLLTAKAITEGEITVFGGAQWRPFVHVDDAASAVVLALESPRELTHARTFNVGSNEQNLTIADVGQIVSEMVPEAELVTDGDDGERRDYRVDFTRIRRELGFRPRWTVQMGVQQVIDAFDSGEVTDYRDARYSNVKALSEHGIIGPETVDLRSDEEPITVVSMDYVMQFNHRGGRWVSDLVRDPTERRIEVSD